MNLKELSQALGLSQTTVSRALNGYPEVKEATRKRVAEAARSFNYTPSSLAKGLATGRTMAIGQVIPVAEHHDMVNPIFGDFTAGAGEIYAAHGYELVLAVVGPGKSEEQTFHDLKRRGAVDGIVLQGPRVNDDRIAFLTDLGLPFVVHGRATGIDLPYAWLDVNNTRAFAQAVDHLTDLGHRRIGLINGPADMDFAYRRRIGFEKAHAEAGLSHDTDLITSGEMSEDFGYQTARRWLASADRPTALVVSSILSAIGVRRAIGESPFQIGTDVSVVIFDDMLSYLQNGVGTPYFSAVQSSVRQAGRQLAQMLLDRIALPDAEPVQTLLDARFIQGQSSGPAPTH
jgi:LacI family transcriptional regulator